METWLLVLSVVNACYEKASQGNFSQPPPPKKQKQKTGIHLGPGAPCVLVYAVKSKSD